LSLFFSVASWSNKKFLGNFLFLTIKRERKSREKKQSFSLQSSGQLEKYKQDTYTQLGEERDKLRGNENKPHSLDVDLGQY
jgi:hypothetical protein